MVIDRIVEPRAERGREEEFLASRTALVTGGGRRVGRALAVALAAEGAHVVVHCHLSQTEGREVVREIEDGGGTADLICGDLQDATVAASLPAQAAERCGNPLDILINNAAVFTRGGALETSTELWDQIHAVNLRAPFLLAQGFAAQLPAQWTGDIINLNDARSLRGDPEHFAYAIAKVGLQGLTRNLARALAPRIAVNELSLGAVLAPEGDDGYLRTRKSELPSGSFPSLDQVIASMMFLLGSRGVTGQTLRVDGGQFLD